MDLRDEAAAQRLHARRVARALATGTRDEHDVLPDPPLRGLVAGVVLALVVLLLTGVVALIVAALAAGTVGAVPARSAPAGPVAGCGGTAWACAS